MRKDRAGAETGIYVICNDKALLDKINLMLRCRGVIGVTDAEGKQYYFVDARGNNGRAIAVVSDLVTRNAASIECEWPDTLVTTTLKTMMLSYDFDVTLMGSRAIMEIVRRMVIYRDVYFYGMRELYAIGGGLLRLSYEQTERDIRYAIRKSSFECTGMKTTAVLRIIADEVTSKLEEIKRQSEQNRLPV